MLNFSSQYIYPLRQKRQIADLMVYKRNIIDIRNSVYLKKSCRISYIKKTTKQVKEYNINVKSYYVKRDTKQVLIFAVDIDEKKQKTFLLNNILNVIILDNKNDEKQIKIN